MLSNEKRKELFDTLVENSREDYGFQLKREDITDEEIEFLHYSIARVEGVGQARKIMEGLYRDAYINSINPKTIKKLIVIVSSLTLPFFLHIFAIVPVVAIYLFLHIYLKSILVRTPYKRKSYLHKYIADHKKRMEELYDRYDKKNMSLEEFQNCFFYNSTEFLFSFKLRIMQYNEATCALNEIRKKIIKKKIINKIPVAGAVIIFVLMASEHLNKVKDFFEHISIDSYIIQFMHSTLDTIATACTIASIAYLFYELLNILSKPIFKKFYMRSRRYSSAAQLKKAAAEGAHLQNREAFKELVDNSIRYGSNMPITRSVRTDAIVDKNKLRKFAISSFKRSFSSKSSTSNTTRREAEINNHNNTVPIHR